MKVYVKQFTPDAGITLLEQGDWFDLSVAVDTLVKANEITYIPLGIAMRMPEGFEAIVVSRSSTPKKHGIILANSIGVIDNSYHGDEDQWQFPALSITGKDIMIKAGTRIAQFKIQLSQKACFMDKLNWLFSGKPVFKYVESLGDDNRGGLGSTGEVKC